MKKKIFGIAKKYGCEIESYCTYKSDMGFQVFEVMAAINNIRKLYFTDSYPIGTGNLVKNQDLISKQFEFELFDRIASS